MKNVPPTKTVMYVVSFVAKLTASRPRTQRRVPPPRPLEEARTTTTSSARRQRRDVDVLACEAREVEEARAEAEHDRGDERRPSAELAAQEEGQHAVAVPDKRGREPDAEVADARGAYTSAMK